MDQRSLTLSRPDLAEDSLGFFRWGRIAGKVLVTTDAGDWAFLNDGEFNDLLAGRVVEGHDRFEELRDKGLLRDGLDLDALASRVAGRTPHMRHGPRVHVLTVTLTRGPAGTNGRAVEASDLEMTAATAEQIVELALQSTSPSLTFEFQAQGGEPLRNFDVLRHAVEFAQSRSTRSAGKALSFRLLTNLTGMNEQAAEWLIANEVLVSTSLDGPAAVHDANRTWKGGSAHADVVRWIEYFHRRYAEVGRDPQQWHVDALLTTTRRSLEAGREIVDEYVARGLRTIQLQPLASSRVDRDTWATIGYSPEEYLAFYRKTLDYILELNRRGVQLSERTATIFLMKILGSDDRGAVDIQSPHSAGTGQLAYNVDGRVFPDDEARMVDGLGDPIFELGHVRDLTIPDIVRHSTVRAIAAASLLDAQPMCADCWNKPFCGFSPVRNFVTQGDLFGQRPRCFECKEHMAVSTALFELLADAGDADTAGILRRWTDTRPSHLTAGRALTDAP